MENLIYIILLALHNIALVGCVAGPFYMSRIVANRSKYGKKIIFDMDSLMEDVITSQPMLCWLFIIILYATGFGFPVVYLLFHGALKEFSSIALVAFILKHILILGIVGILFYGTFFINPKIKELFSKFKPDEEPDEEVVKEFFSLRALRKRWCDVCLVLGILVLLISPILRFYG
ncbi:MAG: hypothetical protein ACE5PV_01260 [Candidatus Poribacteria bacterium]